MPQKKFTPSTANNTPKTYYSPAHRDMIRNVVSFAFSPQNLPITNLVPNWKEAMTALSDKLILIDDYFFQKALPIKWAGLDKRVLKNDLANTSFGIMSPVNSYAMQKQDSKLYEVTNFSHSSLFYGKYNFLVDTTRKAHAAINAVIGDLAPIGVTPAMLSDWQKKIDDMQDALSLVMNTRSSRKTLNSAIQDELRNAVFMCIDQLDALSVAYKTTHPSYFTDYHNNRKLNPYGTTHTKLRVIATDELKQPVYDAVVRIPALGLEGRTTISGDCTLYVPRGVHEAMVSYNGATRETGPIEFIKGHTVTKKIEFAPAGFVVPEHAPQTSAEFVNKQEE